VPQGSAQASRRTFAGSIREARHAGHPPARAPTAADTTAAPTSVAGSHGSSPYSSDATNFDAHTLTLTPTNTPNPTSLETRESTRLMIPAGAAPSGHSSKLFTRGKMVVFAPTPEREQQDRDGADDWRSAERPESEPKILHAASHRNHRARAAANQSKPPMQCGTTDAR